MERLREKNETAKHHLATMDDQLEKHEHWRRTGNEMGSPNTGTS
jgi:hypothetical protein